jgi:DinB family protein
VVERLWYDEDKAFFLADDAATIARIVRTVPAETLRTAKLADWTALEVIGHVTDASEIFADRVQRCLDEDNPRVAAYDQDALAAERRNNERDPMELSRRLSAAHGRIVQLLQRPGAAARPGTHSDWGQVDAGHFATYQANHSHGHTSDLAALFPPRR